MSKNFKKLKLLTKILTSLMFLSLFSSIIISVLIVKNIENSFFKAILSIISCMVILGIFCILLNTIYKIVQKKIKSQAFISIHYKKDAIENICHEVGFLKIDNESYLSVKTKKNLETLCVHFITKDLKDMNKKIYNHKCNKYVKHNYEIANATCIAEKHWAISINIFVFNKISDSEIDEFFQKKQDQNYEIGKMNGIIDLSSDKLYIPEYSGKYFNYYVLKKYEKFCKYIEEIFIA